MRCIYMQECSFVLAHTSSIPMGAINFYMQECFLHLLIPLLFKCSYIFNSHRCNVRAWNLFWANVAKPVLWQLIILLPCTLAHMSYIPMGDINFYKQESFLHLLIPLLFECSYVFYSHGCNVRAWNLFWAKVAKLVLWLDDFISLYTRS